MTLADIRSKHGVPAFKDAKIRITIVSLNKEQEVTIIGAAQGALKIKLEDGTIRLAHPTFGVTYL